MNGVDDKELNSLSAGEDYSYTGGLTQIDWAGLANNRLVASGIYNWVRPPCYDAERQTDAFSALLRYYLGGWKAVNIALHTEYTRRKTGKDDPLEENELAFILDFDF
jgi:hypothetical protein